MKNASVDDLARRTADLRRVQQLLEALSTEGAAATVGPAMLSAMLHPPTDLVVSRLRAQAAAWELSGSFGSKLPTETRLAADAIERGDLTLDDLADQARELQHKRTAERVATALRWPGGKRHGGDTGPARAERAREADRKRNVSRQLVIRASKEAWPHGGHHDPPFTAAQKTALVTLVQSALSLKSRGHAGRLVNGALAALRAEAAASPDSV